MHGERREKAGQEYLPKPVQVAGAQEVEIAVLVRRICVAERGAARGLPHGLQRVRRRGQVALKEIVQQPFPGEVVPDNDHADWN